VSILVGRETRVLVQGITGVQARADTQRAIASGSAVVAGVTPGRGGESVHGVPVYDTVAQARAALAIDASVIYVPPLSAGAAALEAVEAGIALVVVTAEGVPVHDALRAMESARRAGSFFVGCNTNGIISPGKSRIGGIGGAQPDEIYAVGRIGICSRSGGMSAELARTLKFAGFGVSTCVSMGGDRITGRRMLDYALLFEDDAATDAIVVFGEPGTANEAELAEAIRDGRISKPVIALIAGAFQERYPAGRSFGHAAALISRADDRATSKKHALREAGAGVAETLDEIPTLLMAAGVLPTIDDLTKEQE